MFNIAPLSSSSLFLRSILQQIQPGCLCFVPPQKIPSPTTVRPHQSLHIHNLLTRDTAPRHGAQHIPYPQTCRVCRFPCRKQCKKQRYTCSASKGWAATLMLRMTGCNTHAANDRSVLIGYFCNSMPVKVMGTTQVSLNTLLHCSDLHEHECPHLKSGHINSVSTRLNTCYCLLYLSFTTTPPACTWLSFINIIQCSNFQ